jgi:TRAP-type transport system periplasmic protein
MHVRARALAALASILIGTSLALDAAAQATRIRLAHATQTDHPFDRFAVLWKQAVEKRVPGKVEVQIFGNRQLGDDRQVLEATIAGTIDASIASSVLYPFVTKKPSFDALQIPFLFSSYKHLEEVLAAKVTQELLADLDSAGLKGVAIGDGGLRHFLSVKGAVRNLADFKGLKTRIVPVPLHKAMWEAVGTNPVGLAYGEIYTSLQTKTIDAVEINISSVFSENMWEAAKHMTLTGHYFWPGVLAINKARFDKLPADVQQAMIAAGNEIVRPQVQLTARNEDDKGKELQKRGVQIYQFSDLAAMRDRMKPVVEQWTAKDPKIASFVSYAQSIEKNIK